MQVSEFAMGHQVFSSKNVKICGEMAHALRAALSCERNVVCFQLRAQTEVQISYVIIVKLNQFALVSVINLAFAETPLLVVWIVQHPPKFHEYRMPVISVNRSEERRVGKEG